MSHLGKNEPDISTVLTNQNTMASGQVIILSEGVALSGTDSASLGPALVVVNPTTGKEMIWLYEVGTIAFGGEDDRTSFRGSASQVSVYHKSVRAFYYNSNGINMGEKRMEGWRQKVSSITGDATVSSQNTGIMYDNTGAGGIVTITLNTNPTAGANFSFVRTANFAFRVKPASGSAIITPTGVMPDENYIELGTVGSFITLQAVSGFDWVFKSSGGTINPQP